MTKRQRRGDAVVRLLWWAVGITTLFVLTALMYVAAAGYLQPASPRTLAERTIQLSEATLKQNQKDPAVWADYIDALNYAGRYSKASKAFQDAKGSVPASEAIAPVYLSYVRLQISTGDESGAAATCDQAIKFAEKYRTNAQKKLKAVGVAEGTQPYIRAGADDLTSAYVLKAQLLLEGKKTEEAVEAATKALEYGPTSADVLVMRGKAYVALGKFTEAKSDFSRAAAFGYEPAKTELDKLEKR